MTHLGRERRDPPPQGLDSGAVRACTINGCRALVAAVFLLRASGTIRRTLGAFAFLGALGVFRLIRPLGSGSVRGGVPHWVDRRGGPARGSEPVGFRVCHHAEPVGEPRRRPKRPKVPEVAPPQAAEEVPESARSGAEGGLGGERAR
eukprot:4556137-Pyramimonas_sp.AAC.1